MKILFIGDVFGRPGRRVLRRYLGDLKDRYDPEFTVVNAENAAGGFGVTESVLDELLGDGEIDVLTSGNHIWDKREALDLRSRHKKARGDAQANDLLSARALRHHTTCTAAPRKTKQPRAEP